MTMSQSEFLIRELRRRRVPAGLSQEALGELMLDRRSWAVVRDERRRG